MHLILQEEFLVVFKPFGSAVKFQFPALFTVDHLSRLVVSSLIHFLR